MAEEIKVEITRRETIKPSSPTPQHLRSVEFSIMDQLAPDFYVPRVRNYLFIECNDNGAEFVEARVPCLISDILQKPDLEALKKFLPVETESKKSSTGDFATASHLFPPLLELSSSEAPAVEFIQD
ncbi:hypothetical protein TIFTF001_055112, partial [Ficus carica]